MGTPQISGNPESRDVRPMTPNEVLQYFGSLQELCAAVDEADDRVPIGADTTISEWADIMLVEWPWHISSMLETMFEIECSRSEWDGILLPRKSRTLREVCEFIARRAVVPVAEPVRVLGVRCEKAGMFVAVRRRMAQTGVDVSGLRPSTALQEFAFDGLPKVYKELTRLSPHLKSIAVPSYPSGVWHLLGAALLLLTSVGLGVGMFIRPWPFALLFILSFGSVVLLWWHSNVLSRRPPNSVFFRGLKTFRDLCELMARRWAPTTGLRCTRCGYPLSGLHERRCPECGREFSAASYGLSEDGIREALRPPDPLSDEPGRQ